MEEIYKQLAGYRVDLLQKERSENTIDKYMRDVRQFLIYVEERTIDKSILLEYKQYLISKYATSSVNSMLAAINSYLVWSGLHGCKVKLLKVQRKTFVLPEKELSYDEYKRLVQVAEKKGDIKLSLLIQTICTTGIRVSELQYITVQSIKVGRGVVSCKGKQRIVILPRILCKELKKYCKTCRITEGSIFISKYFKPLNRSNIWKMMKKLAGEAHVDKSKIFPHNLRHLFARTFYKKEKDISCLADILGHSNINTTRIYTTESSKYHEKQLAKLQLMITSVVQTT